MRSLDHREPGILGTVLTSDALFAELICDGVHTAPEMVQLWWRAKGPKRAILVTDAMSAAGMPDGEYRLGGLMVQVAQGRAMANGVLAGSVLTLDRALANFVAFTGATVEQGLRLLTSNPAAMTGLEHEAGSIATGRQANLVAVSAEGKLSSQMSGPKTNSFFPPSVCQDKVDCILWEVACHLECLGAVCFFFSRQASTPKLRQAAPKQTFRRATSCTAAAAFSPIRSMDSVDPISRSMDMNLRSPFPRGTTCVSNSMSFSITEPILAPPSARISSWAGGNTEETSEGKPLLLRQWRAKAL
jgi:hypothetical protein